MCKYLKLQMCRVIGLLFIGTTLMPVNASATALDPDTSTAAIETSITILVNSTLDFAVVELGNITPDRDRVGLDLYYRKPGDAIPLLDTSFASNGLGASVATAAGTLAGLSSNGLSEDVFLTGPNIGPGGGLTAGTLPTVSGYLNNIGGVGYTANTSAGNFPDTFPVDLAKWRFSFPNVGTVHFTHCGILDNDGNPVITNGNIYHEIDGNMPFPTVCSGEVVVNVVPVPEPNAFLVFSILLNVVCGHTWLRIRRSFTVTPNRNATK